MAKPSYYRAIMSGDHHMSNGLSYALPSEDGRTDRLDHQLKEWLHMRDYALEVEVDGIFLLGDLFDKAKLDPVTLAETTNALLELSEAAVVYILPGNHGAVSIKGERFNVEIFKNIGSRIRYIDQMTPIRQGPITFWPLEYMPRLATLAALKTIRTSVADDPGEVNVLLFHNSVVGCSHLAWLCDDGITPEELLEGFDYAIGGHFHTHQKFGDAQQGMYTGAWMQHDFGDRGEKRGFWDIKFKHDGSIYRKHIRSQTPRFWYADPYTVPKKAKSGDYVRWEIEATHADFERARPDLEDAKREHQKAGYHVEFKPKYIYQHTARIVETDEMADVGMAEMVSRYVGSDHVEKGTLDLARLKSLGAEIMAEADRG